MMSYDSQRAVVLRSEASACGRLDQADTSTWDIDSAGIPTHEVEKYFGGC